VAGIDVLKKPRADWLSVGSEPVPVGKVRSKIRTATHWNHGLIESARAKQNRGIFGNPRGLTPSDILSMRLSALCLRFVDNLVDLSVTSGC